MNQAKASMNVVFNFHKGDQQTARTMLELLLTVDEGVDCTYYLQYGDSLSTLEIKPTVDKFIAQKQAYLSNEFPDIEIPSSLIESDPNLLDYPGNHTNRSKVQKMKHLGWNLCVYKYIQKLDAFLMLEPDSVVLKHGWLKDIHEGWLNHSSPIMGHLKMGRINGQFIPTHWAGSSVYDCIELRKLPLEKYFYERYPNPWWPYRNNPDTVLANNCFWGPMFSGYDISYDYFLFGLYWREKTDSNDPYRWPFSQMENRQDLIVCDFHSKLEFNDIMDQFVHRISLLHGIKRDDIREKMKSYFLDGKPKKKHLEAQAADYFPLVSVILCNFNYGQYIGEAIESVLAQSYPHFELLIVDDGSTDNSREVITRYANLYPDKIITIFKENGGQASAFNAGFEHVKGEIVSFLDSDDAWLPEKLELVVQIFREQDYAIVQHNLLVIDANSNKSRRIHPNLFVSGDVFNRYFVENHVGFFTSTSGISALRKYLAKVFPLDETWQICADIPLVVLLPLFGEVRTLSQHVGYYRIHEENNWMNTSAQSEWLKNQTRYVEYLNNKLPEFGVSRRLNFKKSSRYKSWMRNQQPGNKKWKNSVDKIISKYLLKFTSKKQHMDDQPYAFLRLVKQKMEGLWGGFGLTVLLGAFAAISSFKGRRIAAFLATFPLFFVWRRRMVQRFRQQQKIIETQDYNIHLTSELLEKYSKFSEKELLLALFSKNTGNCTLIDVGCHIGSFCIPFAQKGWRVIGFEPEPTNFRILQTKLEKYPNVILVNKAVSDVSDEQVPFYVSSEHWGIHSLQPFHATHQPALTVSTIRLDDVLADLNIDNVTILKIDVEGADFLALKSFDFNRFEPEVIMCEFMDDRSLPNFGYTHHDMAMYMEALGYKTFVSEWSPIVEYGRENSNSGDQHHFLQCVPYLPDYEPSWGNLIFIRKDMISVFQIALMTYQNRLEADAYFAYARALQESSNSAEAIAAFKRAIGLRPDNFWSYAWLARVYQANNQTSEALLMLDRSLNWIPNEDPNACHFIANTYRGLGQIEQAIKFYEQALSVMPDSYEIKKSMAVAYKMINKKNLL